MPEYRCPNPRCRRKVDPDDVDVVAFARLHYDGGGLEGGDEPVEEYTFYFHEPCAPRPDDPGWKRLTGADRATD